MTEYTFKHYEGDNLFLLITVKENNCNFTATVTLTIKRKLILNMETISNNSEFEVKKEALNYVRARAIIAAKEQELDISDFLKSLDDSLMEVNQLRLF